MNVQFYNVEMLRLLLLVPLVIALFIFAAQRRRHALARFIKAGIADRISISANSSARAWKAVWLCLALVLIILAIARPGWNLKPRTVERRGRDVVFVLDVSRSMLAEDLKPNRLERAKLAINDCVDRLQGDRVGLVVFAGSSVVKCPLTLDYGFFRMMLNDVSTTSVSRGGTKIGDALRKALNEAFDDQAREHRDLILITDGDDQDSFPIQAAEKLGESRIRIIAIGLGDEREGQRIPVTDERGRKTFLTYNGQEIWSKLDAKTLRQMVTVTPGGRYFNVAVGTIDLGDVYTDLIASAEKRAFDDETTNQHEEQFQIFLSMAFLLICVEMAMSERKKKLLSQDQ